MRPGTPKIIITTKEETLAWLAANDETFNMHKNPVKSLWLCHELNRFGADGFVYNRQAQDRICAENGLTKEQAERRSPQKVAKTEGGLLGTLVYYAQRYREEMKLDAGGWVRATQSSLLPFANKTCAAINNGSLTGEIIAKVKAVNGRLRLAPPRSRNRYYAEYEDWWIKPLSSAIREPDRLVLAGA